MVYKWIFFTVVLMTFISSLSAQKGIKDTIIQIEDIEVRTSRLKNFALGTSIDRIEPQVIIKNNSLFLTDIFSSLTGMSIKAYGLGGLSTISIRGGGSAHTAVLWNGLNIQSPMSGMANLSTIPGFLINEISIQQGGSGTLYGSGAVGGIIHISSFNSMKEQNNISFQAGYGSFNTQNLIFSAKTGDQTYAFSLKIFKQSAVNNFEFTNTTKINSPIEKQTNAAMRDYGFMPDLQVVTSKNSLLSISALYQKYNKDIQTIMTASNPNQDSQSDDNLLVSANWKYVAEKYTLNVKSGIIQNRILMIDKNLPDPFETPTSKNVASSIINEVDSRIYIAENHILNVGINFTNEKGESLGYMQNVSRNRIALFSSFKIIDLIKGLNMVFSLRDEFQKNGAHPLTFSLGSDYEIDKNIGVKGNISKNYRIPSFNDLYWIDSYSAGNPDLMPESGYSGEVGLYEKLITGNIELEFSQTTFATSIKDWIIWLPDQTGIWSPGNKEKGKSNGLELKGKGKLQQENSIIEFNGFYSFTNAKITSNDEYNDKQMIYVPKHRFMASADYTYKRVSVNFNFNHFGKRYYDSSHTLPAYLLGNLVFYYDLPIGDNKLRAEFRINNIWDTEYQAMAWYAMPKRNYLLSLNIRINTRY